MSAMLDVSGLSLNTVETVLGRYRAPVQAPVREEVVAADIDEQLAEWNARLLKATMRVEKMQAIFSATHKKRREMTLLRDSLHRRVNEMQLSLDEAQLINEDMEEENRQLSIKLEKYMKINVLNDAFYIWYSGPYGTINNFRLGSLPIKVVDWLEINTALGQAALALSVVAQRLPKDKFLFTKYMLYPLGCQTKVYKVTDAMIKQMYHSSTNTRMMSIHKHNRRGSVRQNAGVQVGEEYVEEPEGEEEEDAAASPNSSSGPGEYNVLAHTHSKSNFNYNYHFDRYNSDHFPHYLQTHSQKRNAAVQISNAGIYAAGGENVAGLYYPVQPLPAEATLLNLYMDPNQTFSLFPRTKFNAALYGLFCCIYELGAYVKRHDPPLTMPYHIDIGDGSGRTCTICPATPMTKVASVPLDMLWHGSTPTPIAANNTSGTFYGSSNATTTNSADEVWTRALKFALADIKWIVAWSTKHFSPE